LARSDRSDFSFFNFINTSSLDVLQRLVESTLYIAAGDGQVAILLRDLRGRHIEPVLLEQAHLLGQGLGLGQRRDAGPAGDGNAELGLLGLRGAGNERECGDNDGPDRHPRLLCGWAQRYRSSRAQRVFAAAAALARRAWAMKPKAIPLMGSGAMPGPPLL